MRERRQQPLELPFWGSLKEHIIIIYLDFLFFRLQSVTSVIPLSDHLRNTPYWLMRFPLYLLTLSADVISGSPPKIRNTCHSCDCLSCKLFDPPPDLRRFAVSSDSVLSQVSPLAMEWVIYSGSPVLTGFPTARNPPHETIWLDSPNLVSLVWAKDDQVGGGGLERCYLDTAEGAFSHGLVMILDLRKKLFDTAWFANMGGSIAMS